MKDSTFRNIRIINFAFYASVLAVSVVTLNIFGLIFSGIGIGVMWECLEGIWFKDQIPPKWWPSRLTYEPPTKDEYDLNF